MHTFHTLFPEFIFPEINYLEKDDINKAHIDFAPAVNIKMSRGIKIRNL